MAQMLATEKEFFELVGKQMNGNEYTPVSVGRKSKISNDNRTWMKSLRNLDFSNSEELRKLAPEKVFKSPINYSKTYQMVGDKMEFGEAVADDRLFGIVGEKSQKLYSVKTKVYEVVQHYDIVSAFADASDDTGVTVFGKLYDNNGKMNIMAFFANTDMGVEFNKGEVFALGMRVYNSHNGQTAFGGSATAVRQICSNLMSWGETLGYGKWKHYLEEADVVSSFAGIIKDYMNKIPLFKDRMEAMQNVTFTLDEAECALWGITLNPSNVLSIKENINGLNPEIKGDTVSAWDLLNAGTAYFSHRTAGDNMVESAIKGLERLEGLSIARSYDGIIAKGADRRKKYWDHVKAVQEGKVIDLTNAKIEVF